MAVESERDKQMNELMLEIWSLDEPIAKKIAGGGNYRAILDPLCDEYKSLSNEDRLAFLDAVTKHGISFNRIADLVEWTLAKVGYKRHEAARDVALGTRLLTNYLLIDRNDAWHLWNDERSKK